MGPSEMNMRILLPLVVLFANPQVCAYEGPACGPTQHILFLAHTGKLEACIDAYQQLVATTDQHDMELLEELGIALLQQGCQNRNPEVQMLTLFGAGISLNEKVLPLLSQAMAGQDPRLQLIALNFLTRWHDEYTDTHLATALRSNYLLVRLQAVAKMAEWQHKQALYQLEALMSKLPLELHSLLPQLFALIHDSGASKILRRLLNSPNADVRMEAIRHSAKAKRDDLLPKIRSMAIHATPAELEACCVALESFQDGSAIPRLQVLATSSHPSVRLAAAMSLYALGRKEASYTIQDMAKSGDLFAIAALGHISGGEQLLVELQAHPDLQIKINATLSLLEKRDARCADALQQILIKDHRDLAFTHQSTPGKGFTYVKAVPSATQYFSDSSTELELSLGLREDILAKTIDLPEPQFIALMDMVLYSRQNDLLPIAMHLLEQQQSPAAIALLKRYQQYLGAPLLRNYCNLTLMRIGEEGPYTAILKEWVKNQASDSFIQLRPLTTLDSLLPQHQITPEESSRLMLESFQFFADKHDSEGINILLDAIKNGHPQNKYALAGLLMRAAL
jgi:HEAT repeat protein